MTLKNVKSSLDKISKSLANVQDNREFLLRNTREIVILCSKSIISVHKGDLKTAKKNLKQAETLLKKYKKKAEFDLRRYLITPEQEYVEAACLIAVVERKEIPSDVKLKVMSESYVLGLLDCIGELKRMVFDKIRVGDIKEALRIFEIMENLYLHLYPFSMYDKVVKEARRKIDVDRILVDDTRGAITEEKRPCMVFIILDYFFVRMLIPVRCFTCGNLIADKFEDYQAKVKAGEEPGKVLDSLEMSRYCCRRMLLTSVESIQQIIPFYEAIQRRHQEVQSELE
ncbi:MAG: DNA-directed RNA polymerase subunit N [Nitrosopumilaceae archaeon]